MVKYIFESNPKAENIALVHQLSTILIEELGYTYKLQSDEHIFTKGNKWTNPFQFNPANWKSEIIISTRDEFLKGELIISTFGQLVTNKEKEYWDKFYQEIVKILNNEAYNISSLSNSSKKASQLNLLLLLIILIVFIVLKCS